MKIKNLLSMILISTTTCAYSAQTKKALSEETPVWSFSLAKVIDKNNAVVALSVKKEIAIPADYSLIFLSLENDNKIKRELISFPDALLGHTLLEYYIKDKKELIVVSQIQNAGYDSLTVSTLDLATKAWSKHQPMDCSYVKKYWIENTKFKANCSSMDSQFSGEVKYRILSQDLGPGNITTINAKGPKLKISTQTLSVEFNNKAKEKILAAEFSDSLKKE